MPKQKYLWLKVTKDEYELPLIVADTSTELALRLGLSKTSVLSSYHHDGNKSCYRRVPIKENQCV